MFHVQSKAVVEIIASRGNADRVIQTGTVTLAERGTDAKFDVGASVGASGQEKGE
jgi:hypothetical protein